MCVKYVSNFKIIKDWLIDWICKSQFPKYSNRGMKLLKLTGLRCSWIFKVFSFQIELFFLNNYERLDLLVQCLDLIPFPPSPPPPPSITLPTPLPHPQQDTSFLTCRMHYQYNIPSNTNLSSSLLVHWVTQLSLYPKNRHLTSSLNSPCVLHSHWSV